MKIFNVKYKHFSILFAQFGEHFLGKRTSYLHFSSLTLKVFKGCTSQKITDSLATERWWNINMIDGHT